MSEIGKWTNFSSGLASFLLTGTQRERKNFEDNERLSSTTVITIHMIKQPAIDYDPFNFVSVLLGFQYGSLQIFWVKLFIVLVAVETCVLAWARSNHEHCTQKGTRCDLFQGDSLWWKWGGGTSASSWMMAQTILVFSLTFQQNIAQTKSSKAKKLVNDMREEITGFWKLCLFSSGDSVRGQRGVISDNTLKEVFSVLAAVYGAMCVLVFQADGDYFEQTFINPSEYGIQADLKKKIARQLQGDIKPSDPSKAMSNAVDFLIWNRLGNHYPEALTLADYTKLLVRSSDQMDYILDRVKGIRDSKMPFYQLQLLEWLMLFIIFTMPFPFVAFLHWYAVPAAVFLTWGYAGFFYGTVALAHPYGSKAYPHSYTMSVDVPGKASQLRADMAKTLIFHRETDEAIQPTDRHWPRGVPSNTASFI